MVNRPVQLRPGQSALVASAVLVVALACYLQTVAPGLSWRNGGADGGDLAAAVASLGVPHPPGYPTYVLLGRAWAALPLGGDLAYRLNLLSAAGAALAGGLAAATLLRLGRQVGAGGLPLAFAGLLAGLMLALAPLTWSQATIAEVYAPGLAGLALLSWLLLGLTPAASVRRLLLTGLVGGLGLGLLPQLALAGPGALGLVVAALWRGPARWRRLTALVGGGLAGLSVFAYLPLSSQARPFVNWGDATTLERFWALVSAAQYRVYLVTEPGLWTARLLESVQRLGRELTLPGVLLALLGATLLWQRRRATLGYLLGLATLTTLFRAGYRAEGNEVYLLPALFSLALLAGLGAAEALRRIWLRHGRRAALLVALTLFGLLAARTAWTAPRIDASSDRAAERFGERVLVELPPDAVIVSERDETTFSLWYRQALGQRRDVVVIDGRLLTWDWYRRDLFHRYPDLEPAAVKPGGLTALARPVFVLDGQPGEEVVRAVARSLR